MGKKLLAKKKYLKEFYWKDYVMITIGLCIYTIGLVGFIKPDPIKIVTGGLTGISLLIEYSSGIPLYITNFLINCVLVLIALKIVGLKFMVKTIYGVVVLNALIAVAQHFITAPLIHGEQLMSGVVGGMLCGAGIGMVFNANGSTGGIDIILAIINKYKNLPFGRGMMFFDIIIICCSYFVFQDVNKIITGLIVMGVMTYTIDMAINGFRQSVQFLIFSKKYDEIATAINKEMNRGCTVLDGMGWYSKEPAKVLVVLAKRSEESTMFRLIKSIDENAFISQSTVRGVYGKGFDKE